jgi:hypothetical protein
MAARRWPCFSGDLIVKRPDAYPIAFEMLFKWPA